MYKLTVEFDTIEDLKRKLRRLLDELEGRAPSEAPKPATARPRLRILCDETIRRLGERILRLADIPLEVYEANSSIERETVIEGVTHVPVKDDLDIIMKARELEAVLVTGDKRLARTAEAYGLRVVYIPPSGVTSAEHYALEVIKRLKQLGG